MNKINFQNLPDTTTPVNATNLNQLQTNVENEINTIDGKIGEDIYVGNTNQSNNIQIDFTNLNDGIYILYGLTSDLTHYRSNCFSLVLKSESNITNIISTNSSTTATGLILQFATGSYYTRVYYRRLKLVL